MSTIAQSPASLAVPGVVALPFGIIAILMPLTAFCARVFVFGTYALIDGISALASVISRRNRDGRAWLAVEGVTGNGANRSALTFLPKPELPGQRKAA